MGHGAIMRNLGDTVARLVSGTSRGGPQTGTQLDPVVMSGSNPGALRAWKKVPQRLADNPGLVVVLHGCTQTAAAYDLGTGWSTLAERYGFIVLFPEQQPANNPGLCFNWYRAEDARRGRGEAASIYAVIEATIREHQIDRSRVFITGLSAGGAMASVMLAAYPGTFASGALFAGLPYGCAHSVPEAFDRMRGHGLPSGSASTAAVLTASGHTGPWPSVSIWHGDADHIVAPENADALVAQWVGVHDLKSAPEDDITSAGHRYRAWRDDNGTPLVEEYRIVGMGHGVPIDTRGPDPLGKTGPYMLEAGLSSSRRLVALWRLDVDDAGQSTTPAPPRPSASDVRIPAATNPAEFEGASKVSSLQRVIEDALKRARLM